MQIMSTVGLLIALAVIGLTPLHAHARQAARTRDRQGARRTQRAPRRHRARPSGVDRGAAVASPPPSGSCSAAVEAATPRRSWSHRAGQRRAGRPSAPRHRRSGFASFRSARRSRSTPPPPSGGRHDQPRWSTGLTKTYGEGDLAVDAVRDVDLDIEAGEVVLVMGPSGSGKTTLLLMLGAMLRPTTGSIVRRRHRPRHSPNSPAPAAGTPFRLRVPGLQPAHRAHRPRERRAACNLAGVNGKAARRTRATELLTRSRARRAARLPTRPALRRREAAGRHRPRAGQRRHRSSWPTSRPPTSTPATAARSPACSAARHATTAAASSSSATTSASRRSPTASSGSRTASSANSPQWPPTPRRSGGAGRLAAQITVRCPLPRSGAAFWYGLTRGRSTLTAGSHSSHCPDRAPREDLCQLSRAVSWRRRQHRGLSSERRLVIRSVRSGRPSMMSICIVGYRGAFAPVRDPMSTPSGRLRDVGLPLLQIAVGGSDIRFREPPPLSSAVTRM